MPNTWRTRNLIVRAVHRRPAATATTVLAAPALAVALILAGPPSPAFAQDETPATCAATDGTWQETSLYMGLSKPGGGAVSQREWDAFVREHFVVQFPYGFTVIDTTGYWRETRTGTTVYEAGRKVVILHPASRENDTKINEIADHYRRRFDQQSVLVSSTGTRVRFCEGS